jgi:hypothetical protein
MITYICVMCSGLRLNDVMHHTTATTSVVINGLGTRCAVLVLTYLYSFTDQVLDSK